MRNKFKTFALICLCALTVRCTFGQESRATIGGKVTDQQGAVIQQAAVMVVAEATHVVQTTTTNDTGDWKIRDLLPGRYDLQITVPGFKPAKYNDIDLQVNDEKILDTRMQVGAQTVSVTVEGGTPLIDTSAAVSGTVVTDTEMLETPSQSDAPTSLVVLTPGVTANVGVNGGLYLWGNSGLSNIAVNGTGYANGGGYYGVNYTIDGGTDTNNLGQIAFEPPMDAVGEFRVVTNAYDAGIGRNLGSTVDLISKTGGRSVHGDLYESNQNNFLNANTYQYDNSHTPKAPVHLNLYGGSAGGPVWIPKLYNGQKKDTFFFFNWDGIRVTTPVNPGYMSIPTAQERAGDFSSSYTVSAGVQYPINIYDPTSIYPTTPGNFARNEFGSGCGPTPVPSTCNVIPSGRIDPVAKAVYALLPLPDSPAQTTSGNNINNYVMQELQQDKMTGAGLRLDQAWNNNNQNYLTMRWNQWSELSVDPFGASFWLNGYLQSRENRGITLDHTVLLKDNYLLDLKYNVTNYFYLNQSTANGHNPGSLGFSSSYLAQMQTTMVPLLEGFIGNLPNYGLGTEYNGYTGDVNQDLTAGVTHTWKTHNLRFGVEYMIQQEGASNPGSTGGTFSFGTNWTNASPVGALPTGSGSSLASFFLGLPTSGSNGYVANAFWSQHYTASYLQDDVGNLQQL
jgi:hypothetical protein